MHASRVSLGESRCDTAQAFEASRDVPRDVLRIDRHRLVDARKDVTLPRREAGALEKWAKYLAALRAERGAP